MLGLLPDLSYLIFDNLSITMQSLQSGALLRFVSTQVVEQKKTKNCSFKGLGLSRGHIEINNN